MLCHAANRLNPLGLVPERFIVAEAAAAEDSPPSSSSSGRALVGVVQREAKGLGVSELRTLVVAPSWRGQGVGSALVDAVLEQARSASSSSRGSGEGGQAGSSAALLAEGGGGGRTLGAGVEVVYLTTVSRRMAFYRRWGFTEEPLAQIPAFLAFEVAAGSLVARLVANDRLVVMRLAVAATA